MKRILPVLIVLCIIGTIFYCLPTSKQRQEQKQPKTLEELNGCKVGIQTGLNYEDYLKEACPDAEPIFFSQFPTMFPALQQGKVDSILTETTSFVVERLEHEGLVAIEEPLDNVDCGIGVSSDRNGAVLMEQLNDFIAEYKSDGTYDEMMKYWFDEYDRGNATVDKSGITGENGVVNFTSEASYEPICFVGEGGELLGFDVDFIYRFCRKYGYEPQIIPLEYDAMSAALTSGRCSVAMGLVEDEERAEAIKFTNAYISYDIIALYYVDTNETSFPEQVAASFKKTFIHEERWKMFAEGAYTTLVITVLSVLFGTVMGLLLYLWVANGKIAEQRVTDFICWIAGSTPTVVLLMILYYILFGNYVISNTAAAIVGFSIVFGCEFYAKIVSGVKAVGTGQEEAARAQGFSVNQTFFRIIFPQAIRHFSANYMSDVVSLIQETSVVGYIAVMDLTKMSDLIRGRTYEAFFPLIATACIYYLLILLVTTLLKRVFFVTDNQNRKVKRILNGIDTQADKNQE